jgi:hypothetical protein
MGMEIRDSHQADTNTRTSMNEVAISTKARNCKSGCTVYKNSSTVHFMLLCLNQNQGEKERVPNQSYMIHKLIYGF